MSGVQRRRKPTSRDVAALAGVAQSTVSAAMSGNRVVAAETKERIEWAMRELSYQPNAGARTLRTSRTNVIALLVELGAQLDAVETMPYVQTVIDVAGQHDYDVVLNTAAVGAEGLRRLIGRSICDAVLLMDVRRDDQRIGAAVELAEPVILIGRPDDPRGLDVVDFDARRAAELLVNDLALTGHTHLVVLAEDAPQATFRAISEFYEVAVERAEQRGLWVEVLVPTPTNWLAVRELGPRTQRLRGERWAMLTRTPRYAEWGLRLLAHHGFEVGVDASFSALCTDEVALTFDVPVTNVSPLPREVSGEAMNLLFARLSGETVPPQVRLASPRDVTRRRSTVRFDLR